MDASRLLKPRMIKKQKYFQHLQGAFDDYSKAFIVNADNVGSKQMQEIRIANRDDWYVSSLSFEHSCERSCSSLTPANDGKTIIETHLREAFWCSARILK